MEDALKLDQFSQYLEEQDRSPQTVRGYINDLQLFGQWFAQTNGEPARFTTITPTDIREYRQYLLMIEQRKASTVNRRLASISALMQWGKQTGQVDLNPVENVRSVPQVESGPRYLDRKEQYALQRAIERDLQLSQLRYPRRHVSRRRDASLVIFLLHTGLRLGEALALRLNDLELSDRKGQVIVRQGKGRKQRMIPLNIAARQAVHAWLDKRSEIANDYLWMPVEFQSETAMSSRSAQRIIRRLGQEAGLPDLTPHMLRHSFAKNLVDSGVSIEKVAALLGHSNLNTTRIYIEPSPHDLEAAVDLLKG